MQYQNEVQQTNSKQQGNASSSSFKQHQLQIAYSETNDTQAITIQTNKTQEP
jgi:hypothetical protein